ncbi:MAG: 16S rRNA processing protein RimM [Bacteroidaceae bacterium]|nr:16S rRNA processing protein RimM [Bacteroidaceae bacterium]
MIRDNEVFRIGTLTKAHGVNGEVVFQFTDDIFDRVDSDYLVCKMEGILVPFFLEEYRFRSDTSALVKFERVDDAVAAARFQGVEVYFPFALAEQAPEGELTWNHFIGMQVEDELEGPLGEITRVDTQTLNTLFEVEGPRGTLLIPAQEDFIVEFNRKDRRLLLRLPEGLLDI